MAIKIESLGIKQLLAIHYYVHNLERSRKFYCERMDFQEVAVSNEALALRGRQRSLVFRAADCVVVCSQPQGVGSRAWRYLQKHPDGVGSIIFEVHDIKKTFSLLDKRGGNPITEIETLQDDLGTLKTFSITTPFGDTTFRFIERYDYRGLFPGFEWYETPHDGHNQFQFSHFDHVTSNFETMSPALLWLGHVMGFEPFWGVEFHTDDVSQNNDHGSGLRSKVFWDPQSKVKFANNEPYRPFFKNSQINIFHEEHRGDGVQHIALAVADIIPAIKGLRTRQVEFMPTPGTYYDMLPERIRRLGIEKIDEDLQTLRDLEILVDGDGKNQYLLQIFLKESSRLYKEAEAGPFFFEIIQRKGDEGFGAGNFRALFESIERAQKNPAVLAY